MKEKPIIQTERLSAYCVNESNKNYVVELYNRKENIEFLEGIDVEKDIELTIECYEKYQGIGAYLIFENDSGSFIGFGGVQLQEPMVDGTLAMKDSDIEFVIIIDRKFGGRGYASEFCVAFFKKFFESLPNKFIPARVSPNNSACINLLKKSGFKPVGETDYHVYGNKFSLMKLDSKVFTSRAS